MLATIRPILLVLIGVCDLGMAAAGDRKTNSVPVQTALHQAVHRGDLEAVESACRQGLHVNQPTFYGVTPLSIACRQADTAMVHRLIEIGADVNQTITGDITPLMLAARAGSIESVSALLDRNAQVDARERRGQTALMWAADAGHDDVVTALIDAGAEVDRTLRSGFTALMFAARSGRHDAAMALIERGANVHHAMDPKHTHGRNPRKSMTALMLAVESAHFELAIDLVRAGADPNDQASGYAPLHAIAWVRRPQKGDNPDGDPPPRGSGSLSSMEFVGKLVALGADVNLPLRRGKRPRGGINHRGATPMLMASQTVDLALMRRLLELGADPTIPNHDGCTTLMAAAGIGNHFVGEHPGTPAEVETAIEMLVDRGLDVNAVDDTGETAMHGAAYRCFPETVRLLASLGADPQIWNQKNEYGWTPMRIAEGYRAGSFKPDPPTIAAIAAAARVGHGPTTGISQR